MNRLAVGQSARAQQAHKVYNRINRLMPLHKTATYTQTTAMSGETLDRGIFTSIPINDKAIFDAQACPNFSAYP